jgi:hypothetical protein
MSKSSYSAILTETLFKACRPILPQKLPLKTIRWRV